jgi:hypothetical protein
VTDFDSPGFKLIFDSFGEEIAISGSTRCPPSDERQGQPLDAGRCESLSGCPSPARRQPKHGVDLTKTAENPYNQEHRLALTLFDC